MTKEIAKRIAEIREALFMLDMKTRLTIEDWNDICQLRREEAELMNLPARPIVKMVYPATICNGVKCLDMDRYDEAKAEWRKAQSEADRAWKAECDTIRNTINRMIEAL
jgi:hypothetical protein